VQCKEESAVQGRECRARKNAVQGRECSARKCKEKVECKEKVQGRKERNKARKKAIRIENKKEKEGIPHQEKGHEDQWGYLQVWR
jgi:hypothetical protein